MTMFRAVGLLALGLLQLGLVLVSLNLLLRVGYGIYVFADHHRPPSATAGSDAICDFKTRSRPKVDAERAAELRAVLADLRACSVAYPISVRTLNHD
jgi:hypothetical protein